MPTLPPLECLRYFEIAARHESFVRAAKELGVTLPRWPTASRCWRNTSDAACSTASGAACR